MKTDTISRNQVVITDFITDDLQPERRILDEIADVVALGATHEDELIGRIENANAIMLYHDLQLTENTIRKLRDCKIIVRCGVGYDNIDRNCARECGISVANVPDYGTEEVADSAIGMMLSLTRGISFLNSRLRAGVGDWSYRYAVPLARLRGKVFGIVGLGRIGMAAAIRAKAFGMDVAYYDPYVRDGCGKSLGIRCTDNLDELLLQSYVLSLHCPLTEETFQLIDRRALSLLPVGSYLVNTARGAVVDTVELAAAIETGHLAGAAIDVLPQEPPQEDDVLIAAWRDSSLWTHHRVIINPHSAFYSEEGFVEMRIKGAKACRQALCEQPIRNLV